MDHRQTAQEIAKRFGSRLKAARRAAGLTQDQLAEAIEFSPISLSKLETGSSRPTYEVFIALCLALNVRPEYLIGVEGGDAPIDAERRALVDQLALEASQLDSDWVRRLLDIAEKAGQGPK